MTRKEAAKILDETPIEVLGITDEVEYLKALEIAISALQEPEQKWIPVSERLPNNLEHDWVLAQVQEDNGYMWIPKVMEYRETKDDWFYDGEYGGWLKEMHGDEYRVIAWQPLPEPYKAGEHYD